MIKSITLFALLFCVLLGYISCNILFTTYRDANCQTNLYDTDTISGVGTCTPTQGGNSNTIISSCSNGTWSAQFYPATASTCTGSYTTFSGIDSACTGYNSASLKVVCNSAANGFTSYDSLFIAVITISTLLLGYC